MATKKKKTTKKKAAKKTTKKKAAKKTNGAEKVDVVQVVKKKFGDDAIMRFGDQPIRNVEVISTGSIGLDLATGIGGIPRGRITEIYGPESCVDGDSFVQYAVRTSDGRQINHKGGSIRRLWERFHGEPASGDGRGKYLRPASVGAVFTAPCLNEEDRIFHNQIKDVVRIGMRECFELVTLGGCTIIATGDHRFFNGTRYVRLGDLAPGDVVLMHTNTPFRVGEEVRAASRRSYVYVKHHPVAGDKNVEARISRTETLTRTYFYKKLLRSRAVVEAKLNGLDFDEYIRRLDAGELDGLKFLGRDDHVHHRDEDEANDSLDNLVVIDASTHGRLHALERHNNLRFVATEDVVAEIRPVGRREVFDLKMEAPFNNYIVNRFVTHNSGKTTLTLHMIAEAQKLGGQCAFVDAEHALDPGYAKKLGVDVGKLLISQPDSGEAALDIVSTMVSTGAVDLIVVDSVAALTPKAELEGDMGDHHVGKHARLMSQAMRKLRGSISKTRCVVAFINQTRMKIGVMFGCFQYDARVRLADGGSERIGKIVNKRLPVEVLAADPRTGLITTKMVTGWHDNGDADAFMHVVTESVGGSGRTGFVATPNHAVLSWDGSEWGHLEVGELEPGCLLGHQALLQFTSLQRQLALGSVLGDGSIRAAGKYQTQLRFGHGKDQVDYARWKQSLMEGCSAWSGSNNAGGWSFDCRPSVDLNEVYKQAYPYVDKNLRALSSVVEQELTLFGAAIWCLDDGTFSGSYSRWGHGKFEISTKSYTYDERCRLARVMERLGCGTPTVTDRGLLWSGERTRELHAKIARFVPPCMQHKLHPDFRGKYQAPEDHDQEDRFVLVPVPVIDIYEQPPTRSMRRFDLTVEGNHTYLVGGLGVHNSPVTTTGGNALKFYASMRFKIARIGTLKVAEESVGSQIKVTVVKNKLAPPFREAEFDILYGKGISRCGEILSYGTDLGFIDQSGAWFSYDSQRIGQGRRNAVEFLVETPEIREEIAGLITKHFAAGA